MQVNGRMKAIHFRDVLSHQAKEGLHFMETLHSTVDRQECKGNTCGAEGNISLLNLAKEVLQNKKCLGKLGLNKRDPDASFRLVVSGRSMRVYVPMMEKHHYINDKGEKVTELDFQIGNLMNRNIFGSVKQIQNLAKKTSKENKDFPKWENTVTSYLSRNTECRDNAGSKVKALNKAMVNFIEACRPHFPQKTANPEQKFEDGHQAIACNLMRKRNDKIAMHKDTPSKFPCALVNNSKDHENGGELFLAEAGFTANYIDGDIIILDGESLHGVYPIQEGKTRFSMVVYNNGEKKEG